MSFLRHQETHQSDDLECERARRNRHALAHRADESPVGYSWRVALQQSPLPLHQPAATLQQWRGDLQEAIAAIRGPHLNLWSHFRGAPHTNPYVVKIAFLFRKVIRTVRFKFLTTAWAPVVTSATPDVDPTCPTLTAIVVQK